MRTYILLLSIAIGSFLNTPNTCTQPVSHIFFDLNGVLLSTSRWDAFKQLAKRQKTRNIPGIFRSLITQPKSPDQQAFSFMQTLAPAYDYSYVPYDVYGPEGQQLPHIMADWLAGRPGFDSYGIINDISTKLEQTSTYSKAMQQFLKHVIQVIFEPSIRCNITHQEPSGMRLLQYLQETYPSCTFGILSNYDTACFARIYNKPELQPVFTAISPAYTFISADIHYIKPDPRIYQYTCEVCGIDPSACIFIDDQIENVRAAQDIGMHAFLFNPQQLDVLYHNIDTLLGS